MAYTPINWQTGDTITAEKMNKMDNGWEFDSSLLFSETVTTEDNGDGYFVAGLAYSEFINAEQLIVTFDGIDYVCPKIRLVDGDNGYGGYNIDPDFTKYPFFIDSYPGYGNGIFTQVQGSHTVSAKYEVVEVSNEFGKARGFWIDTEKTTIAEETVTTSQDVLLPSPYAQLTSASSMIDASSVDVTVDGTTYADLQKTDSGPISTYGAPFDSGNSSFDFSTYPFSIFVSPMGNLFVTQTAGQHSVKIEAELPSTKVSSEFSYAVEKVCQTMPLFCIAGVTTGKEIVEATDANRLMYFAFYNKYYIILSKYSGDETIGNFNDWLPTSSHDFQNVGVTDGFFSVS